MNLIDLVILIVVLIALRRGLRLGVLSLALSAGGFLLGLYLGSLLAGLLGKGIEDAGGRLFAALTLTLVTGFFLAGAGDAIAQVAKRHAHKWKLGRLNNYLGAIVGGIVALFVLWVFSSALTSATAGSFSQLIRSSAIISTLNHNLPAPPNLLSKVERIIDASGFPRVFIGNEPTRGPIPNTTPLDDAVIQSTQNAVVQIVGRGCGGIVEGSGVVVAHDVVATNAHVVGGIARPRVLALDGRTYNASPIYFDPNTDLALLRVQNLSIDPLPITAENVPDSTSIAVMGYPGGGPLQISSGATLEAITALGRDIYNRGMVYRDIYALHASVESGSSGGPVIDGKGRVIGLIFAKSVSEDQVGYALRGKEFVNAIEKYGASVQRVDTGACAAN